MAFDLKSISAEVMHRAPRTLVVGVEKIGKTCFACGCSFKNGDPKPIEIGANSPIVLPISGEEGADDLGVAKFPTLNTYDDVVEALGTLCREDHEYKTSVIDSTSSLEPLINASVCNENTVDNIRKVPGFKTGEAACEVKWRNILKALDYLRNERAMASMIICHSKVRKQKNPDGSDWDRYDIDCEPNIAEMLKRWADVILFCNTKVTVKVQGEDTKFSQAKKTARDLTGGQRFIYTQQRPSHPGGGRGIYGMLPYELPLSYDAFIGAVADAVKQ